MGNKNECEGNRGVDPSRSLGTLGSTPETYPRQDDLVQTGHPNLLDYEKPLGEINDRHATITRSTSPARPLPVTARRVEPVNHSEGNSISPSAIVPP